MFMLLVIFKLYCHLTLTYLALPCKKLYLINHGTITKNHKITLQFYFVNVLMELKTQGPVRNRTKNGVWRLQKIL